MQRQDHQQEQQPTSLVFLRTSRYTRRCSKSPSNTTSNLTNLRSLHSHRPAHSWAGRACKRRRLSSGYEMQSKQPPGPEVTAVNARAAVRQQQVHVVVAASFVRHQQFATQSSCAQMQQ